MLRIGSLALSAALTAVMATAGVANANPPEVVPWQPGAIGWENCAPQDTAECGTLRLPVDWTRPSGETFELAVARRAATDRSRRIGVLLINPGGPGDSGVDFALRANTYFSPDVLARFDVVGFDPRGVGRSAPVRCSAELIQRQPSAYPRDQAEFDRLAAYNRELREDCRRHSGAMFDHADTLGVIQDMDALRRSLGERQISYFGHSYGTLIGQQYAERYGHRVRAMVLTASLDHSQGTRAFLEASAVTAEDAFNEFVAWCDRTRACDLHRRDVGVVWDRLLARADRGEVRDPDRPDQVVPASAIIGKAVKAFKGPDWNELASWVARADKLAPGTAAGPRATAGEIVPFPLLAVFCQDWQFRVKDHRAFADLTAAELRLAPHMRGATAHIALAGCLGWPRANNPQHRLRFTDAPKILLMNARHDPVSAYSWVTNLRKQTRRSTVLVTYDGWGHNVYRRSDCTRGAVDPYLTALTVPENGTRCAAVNP